MHSENVGDRAAPKKRRGSHKKSQGRLIGWPVMAVIASTPTLLLPQPTHYTPPSARGWPP